MGKKVKIQDFELKLSDPDEIQNMEWIGGEIYLTQLLAAWYVIDQKHDIPMNPQILGKPGVGKTTLAYAAAKALSLPVYIFQCTVDTRPEDLIISPVIGENNTIQYHASALVSAMIEGGVCILDEANRMSEKSWASLAPLLDQRRYIESIIAGIKIPAHPNFRICVTMNDDSSTFEVPEYIHSRLQPQIFVEFPESAQEFKILEFHLPFAKHELIEYTVEFLQKSHQQQKDYSVRDGINICRYYLKMEEYQKQNEIEEKPRSKKKNEKLNKEETIDLKLFHHSIQHILNKEALKVFKPQDPSKANLGQNFKDFFEKLNNFGDPKYNFKQPLNDADMDDWDENDFELDEEEEDFDDDFELEFKGKNDKFDLKDDNEDVLHIVEKDEDEMGLDKNQKSPKPNEIIRDFLERAQQKNQEDSENPKSKPTSKTSKEKDENSKKSKKKQ